MQEGSHAELGSMCAAGKGQLCRRNSICAAHGQPPAWLQEAARARGCWHQTLCGRCSPVPFQMPLHLPGPPQTKLEVFALHPCFLVPGALVLWVLFLPVPIRCLPFPPYEQAGAVRILAVITPHALV